MKKFLTKTITIVRWQLNLLVVIGVFVGLIVGSYLTIKKITNIRAAGLSPITYDTQTNFSIGNTSSVQIVGTGTSAYINLTGGGNWWNNDYSYRRQLTVDITGNLSVPNGYAVYVALNGSDASTIYSNSLPNGDDFRVIYYNGSTNTELTREIITFTGSEIGFYFKTQTELTSNDSTHYFLYYKYPAATAPAIDRSLIYNTTYNAALSSNGSTATVSDFYGTNIASQINNGVIGGGASSVGWGNNSQPGSRAMIKLISPRKVWKIVQRWDGDDTGGWSKPRGVYFPASYKIQTTTNNNSLVGNSATDVNWISLTVATNFLDFSRTNVSGATYPAGTPSVAIDTSTTYSVGCSGCWGTIFNNTFKPVTALAVRYVFGNSSYIGTMEEMYVYPVNSTDAVVEPTVTTGSQTANLASSGSWESPGSGENVIDLKWNGGWGNGIDANSTAFHATVGNVDTGNTLSFQMKTAPATAALAAASYINLGSIGSGTTFSLTKSQMEALGVGESNNRYVQIKANLSQTNGSNPQLDKFQLIFKEDTTGPSAVSNVNIGMTSGSWTNTPPTVTWDAATDNESSVYGYCLALDQTDVGSSTADNDPASSAGILANGSSYGGCPYVVTLPTIDLSALSLTSNQQYYLSIKAIDMTGNASTTDYQNLVSFKYDHISPTNPLALSAPQTYQSNIDNITIYWSTSGTNGAADSGGSEVRGYQYRIGATGVWYGSNHTGTQGCTDLITTGSYALNSTYDSLVEGENTFYLRTFDNACNYSDSAITVLLKYSGNDPSEPQSLLADPSTNTANSFAFSWLAPATYSGQAAGLSYCYTVNSVPSATTCTWTVGTSLVADAFATQPGTNTFYVVAKDETGNVNYSSYASANFEANTSAPSVARNIDTADISIKATSNWKLAVSWDAPVTVGAGVASYKIYRATIAGSSCATSLTPFTYIGTTAGTSYSDTGLSQLTYYYCVKACDSANNCSAASSTVSKLPTGKYTTAAGLSSGPTTSSITTKKAKITWSTDRSADSKVSYGTSSNSYFTEEPSNSTQTTDHTINLTSLSPGTTYYYKTKWTDEDGNTGTSSEKSFNTDAAPIVTDPKTKNISISSAIIEFTAKGATKVKIYYGKTTAFGSLKELATSTVETIYTAAVDNLEDGTKYYYKINTIDSESSEYEGNTLTFETLPRPKITNVRVQEVRGSAQPTVLATWTTNTEASSIVTYYPLARPEDARDEINIAMTKGDHKMVLKGLFNDTVYIMLVKGRDKVGNEAVSDRQQFTTATDTRPPSILNLKIEGSSQTPTSSSQSETSQLVVTWSTDEPATSQVEYGEGSGETYSQKTQEDTNLTVNHLVVISGLTPSKVYHLQALSKDKANNVGNSIDTATITPKSSDNAFDLVITNLSEAFGFLGGLRGR